LRRALNIAVLMVWVLAQMTMAASSGVHLQHASAPGNQPEYLASADHGGHGGHHMAASDKSLSHGESPCPVSGAAKPPADTAGKDCCDLSNCHMADVVAALAFTPGGCLMGPEPGSLESHAAWAPASPLPPPNPAA
jgi:hypothetical protein